MESKNTVQFGYHLTLDLYGCHHDKLNDIYTCYKALEDLSRKIGMKALTPPHVVQAGSNMDSGGKDPGGFTGYIIIAESHISIHTFVKRGFVSIDVYSCKEFNQEKAVSHFKEIYSPQKIEQNFINRGLYYPTIDIY